MGTNIIRALTDNTYQNKNGSFMRAHNFCHINVKLLDESEMAPVLSSNEHNRPKVYTQHRDHKKKQNIETRTEHKIKMLHEGFKKWNAKRILQQALLAIAAILGPILQPKITCSHVAFQGANNANYWEISLSSYSHIFLKRTQECQNDYTVLCMS